MDALPLTEALYAAAASSQADRVGALFDAHHERLYRLARRLTPHADDALDLVQETFLKAARAGGAVPHGGTNEEAWLVRVLINLRRDQWRKAAVRARHEPQVRPTGVSQGTEDAFIARHTVWRALDTLPPRRRAVLVMHELEGLPIAAIASLLGITAITVRWHLSKGRRELARVLRSQGGDIR